MSSPAYRVLHLMEAEFQYGKTWGEIVVKYVILHVRLEERQSHHLAEL